MEKQKCVHLSTLHDDSPSYLKCVNVSKMKCSALTYSNAGNIKQIHCLIYSEVKRKSNINFKVTLCVFQPHSATL